MTEFGKTSVGAKSKSWPACHEPSHHTVQTAITLNPWRTASAYDALDCSYGALLLVAVLMILDILYCLLIAVTVMAVDDMLFTVCCSVLHGGFDGIYDSLHGRHVNRFIDQRKGCVIPTHS